VTSKGRIGFVCVCLCVCVRERKPCLIFRMICNFPDEVAHASKCIWMAERGNSRKSLVSFHFISCRAANYSAADTVVVFLLEFFFESSRVELIVGWLDGSVVQHATGGKRNSARSSSLKKMTRYTYCRRIAYCAAYNTSRSILEQDDSMIHALAVCTTITQEQRIFDDVNFCR